MLTNNDIASQKLRLEFEKFTNLLVSQLEILVSILASHKESIPEKLIQKLFDNEEEIDNYEIKLDDQIIKVIVLFKPVASDLRQLFAIYRIIINLERIGDRIIKIVNYINAIKSSELYQQHAPTLHQMAKLSTKMVKKSLNSFNNSDQSSALWTIKKDIVVDEMNHKFLKESIEKNEIDKDNPALIVALTDIRSIISSFERIGDHATNIAEASLYSILGKNFLHQDAAEVKKDLENG